MQKAVIYARYSSHTQRDVSIEQQINACRKYAADQDLEILTVYADRAMTGTNDQRPEFLRMIRDSASGAFSYVIVYTLDRFSRDRYDSAIHKHTLKENGVRVLSAMENIQDNPTGVLMESILEGFAEYYSKELAQKIRRGMLSNAEKCLVNGGTLPYGYRRGPDGHYEIVQEEAAVVREIFSRVAASELMADILRDLNSRGLKTRRGGPWQRNSLDKMLHNESYIGIYSHSGIRIEGGIPAIMDKVLFDRVQDKCRTKKNPRGNPQRRRREAGTYLLTGKLYCGHCKAPMVGVSGTGSHGELHFYYTCKTRRADKHACSKKQVRRDFAERLVATEINRLISQPAMIAWIADCTMEYLASDQQSKDLAILKDRLATVQKEKANIFTAIRRGMIDDELQAMFTELKEEEQSLNAKISLAESSAKSPITREHIIAWVESFIGGDVEDKSYQETLFDAFLSRAYLYDDHIKLIMSYTGDKPSEIDIPFDVEEDPEPGDIESSYKDNLRPPQSPYTNFSKLYFHKGMVVLVSKIA